MLCAATLSFVCTSGNCDGLIAAHSETVIAAQMVRIRKFFCIRYRLSLFLLCTANEGDIRRTTLTVHDMHDPPFSILAYSPKSSIQKMNKISRKREYRLINPYNLLSSDQST